MHSFAAIIPGGFLSLASALPTEIISTKEFKIPEDYQMRTFNGSTILGPWTKYENKSNFHEIVQCVQIELAAVTHIEKRNNGHCQYRPGDCVVSRMNSCAAFNNARADLQLGKPWLPGNLRKLPPSHVGKSRWRRS
jgi:hypothetical protein